MNDLIKNIYPNNERIDRCNNPCNNERLDFKIIKDATMNDFLCWAVH